MFICLYVYKTHILIIGKLGNPYSVSNTGSLTWTVQELVKEIFTK